MNNTEPAETVTDERGQAATVAELREALASLDEFRSSGAVDDFEHAYGIVAKVRARAHDNPVPELPADRACADTDEVIRFACRSCDYMSPTVRRTEDTPHDHVHAVETGHASYDMFTVTRSKSIVWLSR